MAPRVPDVLDIARHLLGRGVSPIARQAVPLTGCPVGEVLGMRTSGCGAERWVLIEAHRGELPDRLEHRQARLGIALTDPPDQALVEKRGQSVEDVDLGRARRTAGDRLHRLEGGVREHREELEQALLGGAEHLVAPPDRGEQGLLADGRVARPALEQRQPASEAIHERLR